MFRQPVSPGARAASIAGAGQQTRRTGRAVKLRGGGRDHLMRPKRQSKRGFATQQWLTFDRETGPDLPKPDRPEDAAIGVDLGISERLGTPNIRAHHGERGETADE